MLLMVMMGTIMLLMLTMMMTTMMVEMKRVLRVLVTMIKLRTCLHKASCNVFSPTEVKGTGKASPIHTLFHRYFVSSFF